MMNFPSKGGGGDFKPLPAGSHFAVCDMIVDLGIQPGSAMYPTPKRKIYMRYEVPAERIEYTDKAGQKKEGPRVIGKEYTASMHENANLRIDLESWRGLAFTDDQAEVFDISATLGKAAMLSVVHTNKGGKVYANIAGISGLPKGTTAPVAENELVLYSADHPENFAKLPEWLQKKVNEQLKEEDHSQERPSNDDTFITDDDIPF